MHLLTTSVLIAVTELPSATPQFFAVLVLISMVDFSLDGVD